VISSIRIQNYQSHEDSKIELVPGVNIFTGSSDSGKSAIVRALRWVILNLPRGDRFRSKWGGDTEVTVRFDNGEDQDLVELSRIRSSKVNGYQFETMTWKALTSGVPDEVSKLLRMSEVNFQCQHDTAFMLAQSAPDLARFLNNIVGLELIDGVSSYANGLKLREQEKAKYVRENIEKLEVEKKALDDSVKDGETVDELDDKLQELKAVTEKEEKVGFYITNLTQTETALKEFATVEVDRKQSWHLVMLADRLQDFIKRGRLIKEAIVGLKEVSEGLSSIPTVSKKGLEALLEQIQDYNKVLEQELVLGRIMGEIRGVTSKLFIVTNEWGSAKDELKKIMPAVCPVCGSPTKKE
jgi:exonuclease SbcC